MVQPRTKISGDLRSIRTKDGNKVEYEVLGEGPPIVMLHGFLANRFTFSRQRETLAQHHRLFLVSLRGNAGSSGPLPTNYGVGTSDVDDLRSVLDAEQLDCVSLFGHSSGGATAFVLATQSPERVARMVLLEPTLLRLLPTAEYTQCIKENERIAAIAKSDGFVAGLQAAVTSLGGTSWAQLDDETQAERLNALAGSAPFVGPHLLSLNSLTVTENDAISLCPPALLIYGVNSFWFERIIADRFRSLRPDLRVITVENGAHNIHRDRPDIVNEEALAFLSK